MQPKEPPLRVGAFTRVFDPSAGESTRWYINDHSFVRAEDGTWHLFGITHEEPASPLEEKFFVHATARDLKGPWRKHDPVIHFEPLAGETHVWAPHVIRHDGSYWMFYCAGGASHSQYRIHLALSDNLFQWRRHPTNPLILDGFDARDPMVMPFEGGWILYYTATSTPEGGHHVVYAMTSPDLVHWSGRREVFRSRETGTYGGPTESPFVVSRNGRHYLFVCTNAPYNTSAVYESDNPLAWRSEDLVAEFPAHAAEVIVTPEDRWFVSRCGWGQGGLYLAPLTWMAR
jgi:sucrose-6-phosphate hydrolase SacC (GH32 family)